MRHLERADTRLPGEAPQVLRWTMARKAELLRRIEAGELSEADACARHNFTIEELHSWRGRAARHGALGLSQTRIQVIR